MVARGTDAWTSSLRATHSHVPTTAAPASERAMQALAIFGRAFVGSLQDAAPESCSWRTWTDISVLEPGKSFGICKDLAMRLRRDALARRKSARRTKENDFSSWQSPDAQGFNFRKQVGHPEREEPLLAGQALTWATPNTATRRAFDKNPERGGGQSDLMNDVANWATPRSSANENRNTRMAPSHGLTRGLTTAGQATQWPTASSRDSKGSLPLESRDRTMGTLDEAAEQNFAVPSFPQEEPIIEDGLNQLLEVWTRPTCPRLSPAFQFWLMGWPHPQTFYGSAEMESCRCAPPTHSCTCLRRLWKEWRRKNLSALYSLLTCSETT